MKNLYKALAVLAVSAWLNQASAQDMHFSQFYMTPLSVNPSLAGALFDDEAVINYKEQWKSIGTPYKTMGATYDTRINKKNMRRGIWGGGINIFSDKAGDSQMGTTIGTISLAYHVFMNKYHTLGFGVSGGAGQRSVRYDALQWGNQYDGSAYNAALSNGETGGLSAFGFSDMGAGIVWAYNNPTGYKQITDNHDSKFNIGISAFHPNAKSYSFYNDKSVKLHPKFVFHGNGTYSINNTNLAWVPGYMVTMQGPSLEIIGGIMARYKLKQDSKFTGFQKGSAFSIGGYLRAKDSFVATTLFEFSHFAIGFSYDVNTSRLVAASNAKGGLEIALRYVTPSPFTKKVSTKARF